MTKILAALELIQDAAPVALCVGLLGGAVYAMSGFQSFLSFVAM